jgi:type III secretion protein N (ATPase)
MKKKPSLDSIISPVEDIELTTVHGRITEVVGMLIKAVVPQVKMGEVCII